MLILIVSIFAHSHQAPDFFLRQSDTMPLKHLVELAKCHLPFLKRNIALQK